MESDLVLTTARLRLEPVVPEHAEELFILFDDSELHRYVEMETPSREEQTERCLKWSRRFSPDGKERWLNWIAREDGQVIGSFQAAIRPGGEASIGYLVRRASQGRGLATEALLKLLEFLKEQGVMTVEASVTGDNLASIRLAEKIGMKQALVIRGAAFFKGVARDEIVFQIDLSQC